MISIITYNELIQLKTYNAIYIDMGLYSKTGHSFLSPYYPWGNIPVPFSLGFKAESVMAIWEGLKVHTLRSIDKNIFSMKNLNGLNKLKTDFGEFIGYKRGISYDFIYNEEEAFQQIFIPSYRWTLEHGASKMIYWLRNNIHKNIVLIENPKEIIPNRLSPAKLLKAYVLGKSPYNDVFQKVIHYHYYYGKRLITWETVEYKYKSIPPQDAPSHGGVIEFDS